MPFQSLFFWNSRPDVEGEIFALLEYFVYVGGVSILVFLELAPGRKSLESFGVGEGEFQSLFFWNSRPDPG